MKLFKHINRLAHNQKLLFWLFIGVLILPNCIMAFTERMGILGRICNVVLPLSAYWMAMTFSRKPGKALWAMFLFLFYDAFEIVLLHLFGEAPIAVDMFLNVVTTNVGEATELLGNLWLSVVFVVVVYGGGLILGVVSWRNMMDLPLFYRLVQRKRAAVLLIPALVLTIATHFIDRSYKFYNDLFPINVTYNLGLAVQRYFLTENYFETSRNFKFAAVSAHEAQQPEVYVLIIGETARAESFGIYGYERNTTPCLAAMADSLIIVRDALSESNTTHKSVPMILSAASAECFDRVYTQRSLIAAFNEAGYATSFYSNQRYNHSFIDFFGREADKNVYVKEVYADSANVSDGTLLELLRTSLADTRNSKKLIVLHTYGSHFAYHERYPADKAIFKPDVPLSAGLLEREKLINSYDNTICYTDYFIASVINMVAAEQCPAAVIYTSDHGEDIYDDSRHLFLHASPAPSIHQIYVPWIAWLSSQYIERWPDVAPTLRANALKPIATNKVTFHTLLDIAGISGNQIDRRLSLASPTFTVTPRYYLNDHNEPCRLNTVGLKDPDYDFARRHHLRLP